MSRVIEAQHPGFCPVCEETFPVGTRMTKHPGGWGHVQCPQRWRAVVGFPNYEVSDLGRVRSTVREDALGRTIGGVELSSKAGPDRHARVTLYSGTERRRRSVHVVVLEAFVGPRPTGYEACHNDDDKANNRLSNLRWDTRSENTLDRVRNGIHHMTKRKVCPLGHELREPNLSAWALRRGHRCCLACDRARATARARGRTFDPEMAHSRYAEIMEDAS